MRLEDELEALGTDLGRRAAEELRERQRTILNFCQQIVKLVPRIEVGPSIAEMSKMTPDEMEAAIQKLEAAASPRAKELVAKHRAGFSSGVAAEIGAATFSQPKREV